MTKLKGGEVNVIAGVGFSGELPLPLVRLTVTENPPDDAQNGQEPTSVLIWMRPEEARKIGMEMIGAAHVSLGNAMIRLIAKEHGLDGDEQIDRLRKLTDVALP